MTNKQEIERLLNQTGRTLDGLPEYYPEEQQEKLYREVIENFELWENRVLHQSDVIELLVGALKDSVPVVRCRDCKHWGATNWSLGETDHVKYCKPGRYMVGENGYCVYGERKDNA